MGRKGFLSLIIIALILAIAYSVYLLLDKTENKFEPLSSSERDSLLIAIESKDIDAYRNYLDNGKLLSFKFSDGTTPLEKLVYNNDFVGAQRIIETGFNLNLIENNNPIQTISHIISYNYGRAYYQIDEITLQLVNQVKDKIEQPDERGYPLLFNSLITRNRPVIFACLEAIKNINREYKGYTALNYALLYNNDVDIIKAIVDKGANVNKLDPDSDNALMLGIALNNDFTVLEYLIKETNVNVNQVNLAGDTALHLAVSKQNVEVVSLLLTVKELNLQLKNSDGLTPKELATNLAQEGQSPKYQYIVSLFPN